jgi:hypothetical protein
MDSQPPHQETIRSIGTWAIYVVVSIVGASLSSLRREVSMRTAFFHVALASFVGPCCTFGLLAVWPGVPWYIGIPLCGAIGLVIFGIDVLITKANKRVEELDPAQVIPERYRRPSKPDGGQS